MLKWGNRRFRTPSILVLAILLPTCHIVAQADPPVSSQIDIHIIQPAEGTAVGNELEVVATISSAYELQSVYARVDDRQIDLAFVETAYCDGSGCHPGWTGNMSLIGLPRGEQLLTVTAMDVLGGAATAEGSFVYDQKPSLTVIEPLAGTVARPQIHIDVTCTDDDPKGCMSITVSIHGNVITTGGSTIDTTVSLASYDGTEVMLSFTALDSGGQESSDTRTVFVESSSRLHEVGSVAGPIWDVLPDRMLFLDASEVEPLLKIRDRASGRDAVVASISGQTPQYGFLTPRGAIFVAVGETVVEAGVFDWRDGMLIPLGNPNSTFSLKVKGDYAIYNIWHPEDCPPSCGQVLMLRDLVAGTHIEVSDIAGNTENDVAANGDVVYWTNVGWSGSCDTTFDYNIFRYRDGVMTRLTDDADLWNTYPLTDGVNVVYRKHTPCSNIQTYAIAMYGVDGEEVMLAPPRHQGASPGWDYQVNAAWVALTRPGSGGELQVWTRSPSGQETQVTLWGTSSRIGAVSPNGEVTLTNGNRLYLAQPSLPPMDIGSHLWRSFWQEGQWFVIIGRSLFLVSTLDTATIAQAVFFNHFSLLFVSAASSAAPDAELFLTVPGCVNAESMPYVENRYVFLKKVQSCGDLDGRTATVTSSLGGLATKPIR